MNEGVTGFPLFFGSLSTVVGLRKAKLEKGRNLSFLF